MYFLHGNSEKLICKSSFWWTSVNESLSLWDIPVSDAVLLFVLIFYDLSAIINITAPTVIAESSFNSTIAMDVSRS